MRIAFAMINCNRRDGSARAVNEVAERLGRRGNEVHVFARRAEDLDLGVVRRRRVPGPGRPEVADFWTYRQLASRMIFRGEWDIVHSIGCNLTRADVITIQNIQPSKQEVLERFGRQESISPLRRLTRRLYLRVTCAAEKQLYTRDPSRTPPVFLPVSRGVAAELRRHYEIGDAPVEIVPNAADPAVFRPIEPAARNAWRAANGLPGDATVCIFSGGEWRRKGLDLAIEAIGRLGRRDVWLYVAGDDVERAGFEALAARRGAQDRVVFGGFRGDIAAALASSDLFLFPSHYEAFSLATIEAAACGLPLAVTKINGAEDFVIEGRTGIFIGREPLGIAAALGRLLESPAALREMGENARRLVERDYTWDRVTDLTEAAYRAAINLRANRAAARQP